ncbi:U4/U6 small nuclear ribonucleoprotein Prp31-like [Homarus americanus]|uniref:U4/U6 small nuclear ribonucleoprotein Prp31 n=1 Tax=Homarus americanus TaxID=6706 RepID=A0A8J5MZI7_HOMAM|nr:U4/U6 small nuclear ribonucleoprotein Prp31-like [Homarus americanus]KAG7169339.1 U4/U6 small nuclear ribonucleoprotein Prp31-like [Homarus americanus]
MSLADELLNDFEDGDEDELLSNDLQNREGDNGEVMEVEFKVPMALKPALTSVRQVAGLWDSDKLKDIKQHIEKYASKQRESDDLQGSVETDPEYKLIVEANNINVDIDDEIGTIHKFVKEKYAKRFPELESLVVNPLEYLNAVRELGNDVDKVKNSEALALILTQATIMVVSVTASTTQGTLLTRDELDAIEEACKMAQDLNTFKIRILDYVESRMSFIAPNLSCIVGASTAAKLMGVAGGLTNLAKLPASNVLLIGKQKKTMIGMAQTSMLPHTGYIYYCDIVQETPSDLRAKAARIVAAKATLAARVDSMHGSPSGTQGLRLREEVEKKLDKLQEPPPVKSIKPLPQPIDAPGKKRGGRRVLKMKERMAVTDLRKAQNRMNFGEIEEDAYQDDLGYTRGQLGKGGAGRIRKITVDEKTRVRLSKTLQKEVQRQSSLGGQTTVRRQVAGTASSVAFTPLQGLEIVNPQAAENNSQSKANKYFSNVLGFKNVTK